MCRKTTPIPEHLLGKELEELVLEGELVQRRMGRGVLVGLVPHVEGGLALVKGLPVGLRQASVVASIFENQLPNILL